MASVEILLIHAVSPAGASQNRKALDWIKRLGCQNTATDSLFFSLSLSLLQIQVPGLHGSMYTQGWRRVIPRANLQTWLTQQSQSRLGKSEGSRRGSSQDRMQGAAEKECLGPRQDCTAVSTAEKPGTSGWGGTHSN